MHTSRVLFILGFGAILAGCGDMMTGHDAMRGAIDDAVDEDQLHRSAARAVTTIPAMDGEVDRHTSRMTAILDDMRGHMGSMQHCSGVGSMMELRDGMRVELDTHAATLRATVNLDDARVEVEHHVGTMDGMFGDMETMLDGTRCGGW